MFKHLSFWVQKIAVAAARLQFLVPKNVAVAAVKVHVAIWVLLCFESQAPFKLRPPSRSKPRHLENVILILAAAKVWFLMQIDMVGGVELID